MKHPFLIMAGRIGYAAVLGAACLAGAAAAQQPAPRGAPADRGGQQADIAPLGWAKLCRNYVSTTTHKSGKEEKQDLNICLTKNETVYINTGRVVSSAAIRQIASEAKQHLMVTVPLEINLK